ncbi:MAG: bifunctional adenosylcobinamide hydrolase/alpha-ribazole phosphatase CbiS [Candidatus Jordarchaeaceae archaeon]
MLPDINVELIESSKGCCALVSLPRTFRAVSSAPLGFGIINVDKILILQVPRNYDSERPEGELQDLIDELKLGKNTVGLMTAAEVKKVLTVTHQSLDDLHITVVATAGASNALIAGEDPYKKEGERKHSGTINIIALVNKALTDGALVNAVITATEAKSVALRNLGFAASGTTTDSIVIACPPDGAKLRYAGTATDAGILLSRAVKQAVIESLTKAGEAKSRNFMDRLCERGIKMENLLDAAMELHIPDPEHSTEEIRKFFVEEINRLTGDVNINSLVCSAMFLEDLGSSGGIHGLSVDDFKKDPVHILADEILGMAIAEYIAGTKGLLNYIRYDRKKPGIIATLGPFLDDVVASLVGGIMSSIYSKL